MNLWEMIFGVVLIGAIGTTLQTWFRSRGDRPDVTVEHDANAQRELKALRERVAVLERIATDRNHDLEQEIERLRDR